MWRWRLSPLSRRLTYLLLRQLGHGDTLVNMGRLFPVSYLHCRRRHTVIYGVADATTLKVYRPPSSLPAAIRFVRWQWALFEIRIDFKVRDHQPLWLPPYDFLCKVSIRRDLLLLLLRKELSRQQDGVDQRCAISRRFLTNKQLVEIHRSTPRTWRYRPDTQIDTDADCCAETLAL